MSTFDKRWRTLMQKAREAEPALPAPPVHRVRAWMRSGAARSAEAEAVATGAGLPENPWIHYGVRGFATAVLLLLVSVWFATSGASRDRETGPLQPGLENAVVEGFWLL